MKKIYNKLVRDKILEILKIKGKEFKYHIADNKEYGEKLWEKLQEEIGEFKENSSVEEMADIVEVITAIAKFHKIDLKKLEIKRYDKRYERGAFDNKIILEEADE
jgi:predicted house-cleaning noncanonical NTP pyrophosphatase (MazG superfamily)